MITMNTASRTRMQQMATATMALLLISATVSCLSPLPLYSALLVVISELLFLLIVGCMGYKAFAYFFLAVRVVSTKMSVHNWDQPWMEPAKSQPKLWHWYMYLGVPLPPPCFLPRLSALLLRATRNKLPVINCENCLSVARLCVKHSRSRLHPAPSIAAAHSIAVARPDSLWTARNLSHVGSFALCSSKSDGHRCVCVCVCIVERTSVILPKITSNLTVCLVWP